MAAGIELAQHYAAEALRSFAASRVSAGLQLADRTLKWLRAHWTAKPAVSLPDIYQFGPNGIRDKAKASQVAGLLEDHGYLVRIEGGAEIDGKWRRDAWRLVPEV